MSDFRGFVCWDPERLVTTIHTEAVAASKAVFLATHTPLRIQRSQIRGRTFQGSGKFVTERGVLDDFLGRRADTGTLLMPVVGDSGTGKSHLVRWVKEMIPPSDKRKVIYLEKSKTSLRNVIEALLDGVEDEEVAQIRADIRKFSSGLTHESLSRRLITALNMALADTKPADYQGSLRQLTGPKGLTLILQDPSIQDYMLQAGRFIPQFAEQMLRDRTTEDAERPPSFTIDDLPINVQESKRAAHDTQKILRLLLSKPDLRNAAADLLNEHWEKSVQQVSSLGSGRILEAMLTVRKIYARQGIEIILLVEDFALIQGLQRDLLDAITEASTREGKTVLAPMRTLMAITSGYFHDLPETALTRIATATSGYIYDLDLVFDRDADGSNEITSFVGRYLNAARLGRKRLEGLGGDAAPNHCDACPVRATCHEAFGASAEGHGLYPFNQHALLRTVHSVAPKEKPWAFVPRTVLGTAIVPTLMQAHETIPEGTFPDSDFRRRFDTSSIDEPLPNPVRTAIHAQEDSEEGDRRIRLLEFWGNAPKALVNLPSGIADAFSLTPIDEAPEDTTVPPRRHDRSHTGGKVLPPPPSPVEGRLSKPVQQRIDEVEQWVTRSHVLRSTNAITVRSVISRAVVYRQDWMLPPVKPLNLNGLKSARWTNKSDTVSIEGASSENLASERTPIRFTRTPTNGEFFKSLVLLEEESSPRPEDVIRLSSLAEHYGKTLRKLATESTEVSDEHLAIGLRVSLLGAALAGQASPGMPLEELFSAAFNSGATWGRVDFASRTVDWMAALRSHLSERPQLVDTLRRSLGLGQGDTGAVKIIDAARALPLLRQAARQWDWVQGEQVPGWALKAARPLTRWEDLLKGQHARLSTILGQIRERHPKGGDSADSLIAAVAKALTGAKEVGLVNSTADATEIEALGRQVKGADWGSLIRLESDLNAYTPDLSGPGVIAALVRGAAPARTPALSDMANFLTKADAFLDAALASAEKRGGAEADTNAEQVAVLLEEWTRLAAGQSENRQEQN